MFMTISNINVSHFSSSRSLTCLSLRSEFPVKVLFSPLQSSLWINSSFLYSHSPIFLSTTFNLTSSLSAEFQIVATMFSFLNVHVSVSKSTVSLCIIIGGSSSSLQALSMFSFIFQHSKFGTFQSVSDNSCI